MIYSLIEPFFLSGLLFGVLLIVIKALFDAGIWLASSLGGK